MPTPLILLPPSEGKAADAGSRGGGGGDRGGGMMGALGGGNKRSDVNPTARHSAEDFCCD